VTTTLPPTSTAPTTPAPSTSRTSAPASTSQPPSSPTAPPPHAVRLGPATISLLAGWVAQDVGVAAGDPGVNWCLQPGGAHVPGDGCLIRFSRQILAQGPYDVDAMLGELAENPEPCGRGGLTATEQFSTATFGGRAAEWRRWVAHCPSGATVFVEQYDVATLPSYILYSDHADQAVHAAMQEIAANSTLPAQQEPLRLMDRGYLRSVEQTSAGVRISLDRVIREGQTVINPDRVTYRYLVPTTLFDAAHVHVGSLVYLASNGVEITKFWAD
jgi:Predicted solute binding protein